MKTVDKGLESENQKCQQIGLKSRHMKTVSKELFLKLKVSTHDFKVSTHDIEVSSCVDTQRQKPNF